MPRSPSSASLHSGISNPGFVGGINVKDLTRIDETSLHFSIADDSVLKASIATTVSPASSASEGPSRKGASGGVASPGILKHKAAPLADQVRLHNLEKERQTALGKYSDADDSVFKASIATTVSPASSDSEGPSRRGASGGVASPHFLKHQAVGTSNAAQPGAPLAEQLRLRHLEKERQQAALAKNAGQSKRLGDVSGKAGSSRDQGNNVRPQREREGVSKENTKGQFARDDANKVRSPREDGKERKKHGDVSGKRQSSRDPANKSRSALENLRERDRDKSGEDETYLTAVGSTAGSPELDIYAKAILPANPNRAALHQNGIHRYLELQRSSSVSDLRSLRSSERYMNEYIEYDYPRPSHQLDETGQPHRRASSKNAPPVPIYAVPNKSHKHQQEARQNRKNGKLLPFIKPGSKAHRLLAAPNYDHISQSAFFTDGKNRVVKGPGVYGHLPDPEEQAGDHKRDHKGLVALAKKRFYPEVSIYGGSSRKRRCWPAWAILLLVLLILLIIAVIIACILLTRPGEVRVEQVVVTAPPVTCPDVQTQPTVRTVKAETTTTPPFNPVGGQLVEFADNPSKYVIVKSAIPWKQAAGKCYDYGGYLAQLESQEEWNQLRNHLLTLENLRENSQSINYWIGGITLLPEASYFWYVSGEPVSSSFWSPGEPNYNGKKENCVAIDVARQGLLNDSECEGLNLYVEGFVCEIPKGECHGVNRG